MGLSLIELSEYVHGISGELAFLKLKAIQQPYLLILYWLIRLFKLRKLNCGLAFLMIELWVVNMPRYLYFWKLKLQLKTVCCLEHKLVTTHIAQFWMYCRFSSNGRTILTCDFIVRPMRCYPYLVVLTSAWLCPLSMLLQDHWM